METAQTDEPTTATVWIAESDERYESSIVLGVSATESGAKDLAQREADANASTVAELEGADEATVEATVAAEPLAWESFVRHRADVGHDPAAHQVAYPKGDRYYRVHQVLLHP